MRPFNTEQDVFDALTRRPFIVIDVETTHGGEDGKQRLVSYAYAVITDGRYSKKNTHAALVNPGIPIAKRSTHIHGITDADVKRKRSFAFHAHRLTELLGAGAAVLVAHNASFDVGVLANEFKLIGLSMPELPVIDTMYLPNTVGYTADELSARPSLLLLCKALGVPLDNHHNAQADTEATSGALINLLRVAAGHGLIADIDELLDLHGRGTTTTIIPRTRISARKSGIGSRHHRVSAEHMERHHVVLDANPDHTALDEWLSRAEECATTRCAILADECEAAVDHSDQLIKPLHSIALRQTEPGQAAAVIGGIMRMMRPSTHPRHEVWFWRNARKWIGAAPRCDDDSMCPDCRRGDPCPLDVAHEYAARSLLLTDKGEVTSSRIDGLIMKTSGHGGSLTDWQKSVPELAAHVAHLCIISADAYRLSRNPDSYFGLARTLGLHEVEPQLAMRYAQQQLGRGHIDDAEELLTRVFRSGSTNPSMVGVEQALAKLAATKSIIGNEPGEPNPKYWRVRRPPGRERVSPFSIPR